MTGIKHPTACGFYFFLAHVGGPAWQICQVDEGWMRFVGSEDAVPVASLDGRVEFYGPITPPPGPLPGHGANGAMVI